MIALAGRIALVEVPEISPILADYIAVPRPYRLAFAVALVLLLVTTAARRWSEPLPTGSAAGSGSWRRDESRYYHERRFVAALLGVSVFATYFCGVLGPCGMLFVWGFMQWSLAGLVTIPDGFLSLALMFLAVQSFLSKRPNDTVAASRAPPRLAPGLFLVNWFALLAIVVFAAPILGVWGFAFWFNRG
jgi:hypothetical protein